MKFPTEAPIGFIIKTTDMKKLFITLFCVAFGMLTNAYANPVSVKSPDGNIELKFDVVDGIPQYSLDRAGKPVVLPSKMGFTLEWRDDLAHAFVLKDTKYSTFDET
jgi:alpha-glucosidase